VTRPATLRSAATARRRIAVLWAVALAAAGCAPEGAAADPPPPPPTATTTVPATSAAPAVPSTTTTTIPPTTTSTTTPPVHYEAIGHSVRGRPILAATFGDGPIRVLVLGGIHGDERAAVDNGPLLAAHLAETVPEGVTVRFVVDANPDGTAAATRRNADGVDLNRNWPTDDFRRGGDHGPSSLSEPETIALDAEIAAFEPEVIVAIHAAWNGPFVNLDGPAGDLAAAAAEAASAVDPRWRVEPELDWPTPGSMGTHFGREGGLPVITIEADRTDRAVDARPALQAAVDAILEHLGG
jgi:protein MpaA